MAGAHRSMTQSPATSVLKSAGWLLMLVGLLLVPLAVLGIFIYLSFADLTVAYLVLIGLQGFLCARFAGRVVRLLARGRPLSTKNTDELIGNALSLAIFTIALLLSIGHLRGWDHGGFEYAMIGVGCPILVAFSAYLLGGKRRLMAALDARAAERNAAG